MSRLKLERHFNADPGTVFAFVTRPEYLVKWWGPEGVTLPEYSLDFTRPGPWSSVMLNNGRRLKVTGAVVTVEPPSLVEFTWAWHDEHDRRGHESKVRFTVTPDGAGTLFTLVHTGLEDEERMRNHVIGWNSSLAKLERLAA